MSARKSSKTAKSTKAKTAKSAGEKTARKAAQPVWTQEKSEKARAAGNYIKLGDKRGHLALSGAAAQWKKHPDFVYLSDLRVAGHRHDVERILGELGMSAADVKRHLANAYRAGSETSAEFLREVEELKALRARGKTAAKKVSELPHSVAYYAEQLEGATVVSRTGEAVERKSRSPKGAKKAAKKTTAKKGAKKAGSKSKSKSASPRGRKAGTKSKSKSKSASPKKRGSPKGKRGAKPLADKLAALAADKVMDVSNLHVDGSGAKVVKEPGAKSKKVLVPGTRLVSDKKNGVKAAAKLLGDETIVQRWVDAKEGHGAAASPSRSRSGSRSPSPARTLPMSPRSPAAAGLPPLPKASSPRSSGSGVTLPRVPTIGSPRS
jgi:hypothetical protein